MKKMLLSVLAIVISLFFITQTNTTPRYDLSNNNFDFQATVAIFNNGNVPMPSYVAQRAPILPVLGDTTDNKKIYVDLTHQRLYAYEGSNLIYDFPVSTGKWGRTPTGTFSIWGKFRYVRMTGGSVALHTYYDLPNVPFTQFFSNSTVPASAGFSLHGTYWHSNFGHPMSHGCVNMRTTDAELMYRWTTPGISDINQSIRSNKTNPGTTIIIYGVTPAS